MQSNTHVHLGVAKHTIRIRQREHTLKDRQGTLIILFVLQVKLNTDDSPGVATEYGIRSIPTIMLFKGGKRLDTIIGAVPKDNLMKTINKILN